MILLCPGCGLNVEPGHECMYRDFAKAIMIRLVQNPDEPEPDIDHIAHYTLRTVLSVPELIEKVRMFDAGLNDAVVEASKGYFAHSFATRSLLLATFQFQMVDDRGDLSFIATGENMPAQFVTLPRAYYEERMQRLIYDLVPATISNGQWLRVDAEFVNRFPYARHP